MKFSMDELRDYRFYEEDLVHPNALAIKIIWKRFKLSVLDREDFVLIHELGKLDENINHKSFYPKSISHQKFVKKILEKIAFLDKKYKHLNLDKETNYFSSQLL